MGWPLLIPSPNYWPEIVLSDNPMRSLTLELGAHNLINSTKHVKRISDLHIYKKREKDRVKRNGNKEEDRVKSRLTTV